MIYCHDVTDGQDRQRAVMFHCEVTISTVEADSDIEQAIIV